MTDSTDTEVAGEHALREGEIDRLGFGEIAGRIANSIIDRASRDGLVIGLDGEWGSGKSSLLHLIERSLNKLPQDKRPTVINFRPWLVGNRDALLTSLFSELADKIAHLRLARGDATDISIQKAKKAAEAVRKFARALSKTGDLVELAEGVVPAAGFISKLFRGAGAAAALDDSPTDLVALKDEIIKDLRELDHRFIITVDDVDRLEPSEVIEVLRLVRSVADFPNLVYLLCYDADRLAEAIVSGAKVTNGAAFLEKIIQLTVMIPKPEPFELRQWFASDLEGIIGTVPDEVRERLKLVIDQEGGLQLRTPRSVVRTLDSIRFFWPAMRNENVDAADLVWLQLIKDGAPALYRWIEKYVASVAATSFGTTMVPDGDKEERVTSLQAIIGKSQLADVMYRHMFAEMLPGIEASYDSEGPPVKIHEKVSERDRKAAIEGRRLASPDHYRMYFSLIGPTHAITQAGFDSFWTAAETGPGETSSILLQLHGQMALGTLRKSDVLFERLRAMSADLWNEVRAKNLLLALGQMMDEAYRQNPSEQHFIVTSWDRAEQLVPLLYAKLSEPLRPQVNEQLFSQGPALGWLTSILRHEIFGHGRFGDRPKIPEKWLLPEAEFERACELMIARYRTMTVEQILATPRPLHILFAWNQAGDQDGPRQLVAEAIKTDEGLVEVLAAFTSSIDSSDRGQYIVLKKENLDPFIDYESTMKRLADIAERGSSSLQSKAARLVSAAKDADRF